MTTDKQKDKTKVNVRVLKVKTHTHMGRKYPEDSTLELTPEQAQWLVGQKVVEIIK